MTHDGDAQLSGVHDSLDGLTPADELTDSVQRLNDLRAELMQLRRRRGTLASRDLMRHAADAATAAEASKIAVDRYLRALR